MDITKQAIAEHVSRRYFEPSTALARVLDEAPYLPRCSDDKTAARVRPRDIAVRYPYMQINRPGFVSWLIFDLDHNNPMIWQDAGLPAPNLIVSNRDTGGAHLFYAIPPVCTSENARSKPIAYMKAVYEAFAARLNADMDFHSGPVAKTPGHPWWRTWELHPEVYELGKLADYVDLAVSSPWGRGPRLDDVSHSRHCIMFEQLRYYAYSIVNREREKGSFEVFSRLLEAYAYNKNTFAEKNGLLQERAYWVLPLTATIFYTFGHIAFDKWAWRTCLVHRVLQIPDLRGKWNCLGETIDPATGEINFKWTAEVTISQSWEKIKIYSETSQSRSRSVAASILVEENMGYILMYSYRNEPRPGEDELKAHFGYAEWHVSEDGETAEATYFNGGGRFTGGRMKLTRTTRGN